MSTKSYIVATLSEELGITKRATNEVLDTLGAILQKDLKETGQTIVPGIGRLKTKVRPERVGRNPKTGEPVTIKARNVVKLVTSKGTKDYLN